MAAIDTIQIFVTGGTFDKEYDAIQGKLYFKHTHLKEILQYGRASLSISIDTLMMVDSLEMTDVQRQQICDACKQSASPYIIITHGTDTMTTTAAAIAQLHLTKTIVITGAMIPYAFGSSDGYFNIGSALAFVQYMPHGTYIVMNGKCFDWNKVQKNRENGFFEPINI